MLPTTIALGTKLNSHLHSTPVIAPRTRKSTKRFAERTIRPVLPPGSTHLKSDISAAIRGTEYCPVAQPSPAWYQRLSRIASELSDMPTCNGMLYHLFKVGWRTVHPTSSPKLADLPTKGGRFILAAPSEPEGDLRFHYAQLRGSRKRVFRDGFEVFGL